MAKDSQFQNWEVWLKLPDTDVPFSNSGQDSARPTRGMQAEYSIHSQIAAYAKKQEGTVELSCLYLLSLFPYPVTTDELLDTLSGLTLPTDQRLRQWNQSPGLHKLLGKLLQNGKTDAVLLNQALRQLEDDGLVRVDVSLVTICRPVAEYFSEMLRNSLFDEWRLQQQQLAYYYDDLSLHVTNDEQRFWLNCKKLLHSLSTTHKQQAMDEVYRPHIAPWFKRKQQLSTEGCQLWLYMLSGFFQQLWDKPDFCLSSETKSYLQAEVGQTMYQLGEKQAALTLLHGVQRTLLKEGSWQVAGDVSQTLALHAIEQQNMPQSIKLLQQSITYAERDSDSSRRNILLQRLRSLFELYKTNGDIQEAAFIADKAKKLLARQKLKAAVPEYS